MPVPFPTPSFAFDAALDAALAANGNQLVVYVHGCCTEFETALDEIQRVSLQIAPAAAALVYTMPTRGDRHYFNSKTPFGVKIPFVTFTPGQRYYFYDENVEAWSAPHLAALLDDLATRPSNPQIHIIAHSLGARLTLYALQTYHARHPGTSRRFGEIVFAAADLDRSTFVEQLPTLTSTATRITVYFSDHDKGMDFSQFIHDSDRLGGVRGGRYSGEAGVDAIDTSQVLCGSNDSSGHFYWKSSRVVIADIAAVLGGLRPSDSTRARALKAVPNQPNLYVVKRSNDCIPAS